MVYQKSLFIPLVFLIFQLYTTSSSPSSSTSPSSSSSPLKIFQIKGTVTEVEWDYNKTNEEFVSEILTYTTPLVIKNSPCTKWKAASKWHETSYLVSQLPYLDKIRRGTERVFVYESTGKKPLEHIHTRKKELVGMEAKEWFDKVAQPKSKEEKSQEKEFYYYSVSLEEEKGFKELASELQPYDFLFVDEVTPRRESYPFLSTNNTPKAIKHSANIWMGSGVISQPHYDPTVNFFFQIEGQKRWILSSAEDAYFYYLHPWAHPCERQSHANLTHFEAEQYMYYAEGNTLMVDLLPGELLYVPAYWMHTVEALDFSISANFWSTSFFGHVADEIVQEGLPVELSKTEGGDAKEVSKNIAYFLRYLVKKVRRFYNMMEVRLFLLEELVKNRYGPFLEKLNSPIEEFDDSRCPADGEVYGEVKKRLDDKIDRLTQKFDIYEDESRQPISFKGGERKETEQEATARSHYCWGVQTIELLDYVEKVAAFVLNGDSLAHFFRCLASKGWKDQLEIEEERLSSEGEGAEADGESQNVESGAGGEADGASRAGGEADGESQNEQQYHTGDEAEEQADDVDNDAVEGEESDEESDEESGEESGEENGDDNEATEYHDEL